MNSKEYIYILGPDMQQQTITQLAERDCWRSKIQNQAQEKHSFSHNVEAKGTEQPPSRGLYTFSNEKAFAMGVGSFGFYFSYTWPVHWIT